MTAHDDTTGKWTPAAMPSNRITAPRPAPDLLGDDLMALLRALPADAATPPPRLAGARERLFARVQESARASRVMHTTRRHDALRTEPDPAPGVTLRTLYAAGGAALRAGEPLRSCLVELGAGAQWPVPATDHALQREWLVLQGEVQLGGLTLGAQDFHLQPAGTPSPPLASVGGALLLLRLAPIAARRGDTALTRRAAHAAWADFAPGIRRRVMWQRDGQAAMLYRTLPGATVPRHSHHHDEECLMLQGDIFLDEVLLRPLDYQLAPAGTGHAGVYTDTGVVLYAHGDLELDFGDAMT
jgi:hypothetical protein